MRMHPRNDWNMFRKAFRLSDKTKLVKLDVTLNLLGVYGLIMKSSVAAHQLESRTRNSSRDQDLLNTLFPVTN